MEKGCPQGSCLGPLLWLIVANALLVELEILGYDLFAFADDFSLILAGKRRIDLERAAAAALTVISAFLKKHNLQLSPGKSQTMTFSTPRLQRDPIMRIDGKSLLHVKHITLLGVTIDSNRNWIPHLNLLKTKTAFLHLNLYKIMGKNWGISNKLLKIWYNTIVEKILLYGAGVWGGSLTKQAKDKLTSLQRPFLRQISRGYKTISTDALQVLTGIPPIVITLEYENKRTGILQLKNKSLTKDLVQDAEVQLKIHAWSIHPARETSHFQVNTTPNTHIPSNSITLYTDGSRTNTGVAAAFCVMEGGEVIHRWACRLGNNNTVYQAELYAILQALDWCQSQTVNSRFKIYSDSLSSLQAIQAHRTKHPIVHQIKIKLIDLRYRISLAHVKSHIGIEGNETADRLANRATSNNEPPLELPLPPSYIKKQLKNKIIPKWQEYWDNSYKGEHTYTLIQKVSLKLYNLTPPTTAFLTGHGPFMIYLKKYHLKNTDTCRCGEPGTPNHAYYECQYTATWHLKRSNPTPDNWLSNILSRPPLLNKLKQIYCYLQEQSDNSF